MNSTIRLDLFTKYHDYDPLVSVFRVTDGSKPTIHRFFDTSPISPSGRYIALTEFPFEDRMPKPGDEASVLVIDLATREEVYRSRTAAWDTQLGAQVQWGASDAVLIFNRMDGWRPHAVLVDIATGRERPVEGTVYMASPDGQRLLSPCLRRIARVQAGYGVVMPADQIPENEGFAEDDGIYVTDLGSGKRSLLLSLAQIREALPDTFARFEAVGGGLYTFHVKWNPQGTRIMAVLRWISTSASREVSDSCLITADADGTNIRLAIGFEQWRGGHHPNWCPDGEHIVMNLAFRNEGVRFCRAKRLLQKLTKRRFFKRVGLRYFSDESILRFAHFRFDGANLKVLGPSHLGSGHPTLYRDGRHVLADAYPREPVAYADGSVPLRWLNSATDTVRIPVRIKTLPSYTGPRNALRVDPHPAWDRSERYVVFNGCPDGIRQVFVADFASLV